MGSMFLLYLKFLQVFFFCAEQDAGLEALSSVLSRQKQMGQEIGNELEEQNGKNNILSQFDGF